MLNKNAIHATRNPSRKTEEDKFPYKVNSYKFLNNQLNSLAFGVMMTVSEELTTFEAFALTNIPSMVSLSSMMYPTPDYPSSVIIPNISMEFKDGFRQQKALSQRLRAGKGGVLFYWAVNYFSSAKYLMVRTIWLV